MNSILKIAPIIVSGGAIAAVLKAFYVISEMNEQNKKVLKLAKLNNRVVKRFIELSPEEVVIKVQKEFEFDLVTLDVDL